MMKLFLKGGHIPPFYRGENLSYICAGGPFKEEGPFHHRKNVLNPPKRELVQKKRPLKRGRKGFHQTGGKRFFPQRVYGSLLQSQKGEFNGPKF